MREVTEPFPIVTVGDVGRIGEEPMGTKQKFWYEDASKRRFLFKYPRPGTGEHWAEKIVAEIATLLRVPCPGGHSVEAYIRKGRSAFFGRESDVKPLHPIDAYKLAVTERANAAAFWSGRLQAVSVEEVTASIDRVPATFMSSVARDFAVALLKTTLSEMQRCLPDH